MEARRPSLAIFLTTSCIVALLSAAGCGKDSPTTPNPGAPTRAWRMGFSNVPPVPDQAIAVQSILLWAPRSDAAIAHEGVPWDSLLAGVPADTLVRRKYLELMRYYRATAHLTLVFEIDPTDGLDRSAEDPLLLASGHHLSEPAVQALFRQWVAAVDTLIQPEYLGLGSEVNLIRFAAPALYQTLRQVANEAADSVHALHARMPQYPRPRLYATEQVETVWGRLGPPGYQGVATEKADFPFAEVWGLSSYPYLGGFTEPEEIPLDYYSRPANELLKAVMITEGGWSSETVPGSAPSSPAKQARFLRRQAQLLDAAHAIALFDLTFADLALSLFPHPPGNGTLAPFGHTGVVDSAFTPKPALAVWDSLFARTHMPVPGTP